MFSQKYIIPSLHQTFTNNTTDYFIKTPNYFNNINANRMIKINYSNIYTNTVNNSNSKYNRIFYKRDISTDFLNNEYSNITNSSNLINHPVINLELEFKLLKEKINELNKTNLSNTKYNQYNHNNKKINLQKNANKTDNNIDLTQSKIYYNKIQTKEKPIKNNINNYLFINNKFKYNEMNNNNYKTRNNRKYLKNEKLNKYIKILKKEKDKKEISDIFSLKKENYEENDDELSELANTIIKSNESNYLNNKTPDKTLDENDNNIKNFNKFIKNQFKPKKTKPDYCINNVNSFFILSKKQNANNINPKMESLILNELKNNFSIEKLNIEINSNTNSKYYENKKILSNFNINEKAKNLKQSNINNKNLYNNKFELITEKIANINILSKINKNDNKKIENENLNEKKTKVKFDARILTIYYNENDKVPELTIKDNKNQNVEFVPLDMKQYLNLLTSNNELKPVIISKNKNKTIKKLNTNKINLNKKNFTKILKNDLKKIQDKKREITPDIKNKNKIKLFNVKKEKDNTIIKEKQHFNDKNGNNKIIYKINRNIKENIKKK